MERSPGELQTSGKPHAGPWRLVKAHLGAAPGVATKACLGASRPLLAQGGGYSWSQACRQVPRLIPLRLQGWDRFISEHHLALSSRQAPGHSSDFLNITPLGSFVLIK